MALHKEKTCPETKVQCPQCLAVDIPRKGLKEHLRNVCSGITQCKDCFGCYRLGVHQHNCSNHIVRLLQEVVGTKSLKLAQMSLTEKARSKEDELSKAVEMGTLEGQVTDQIQTMKDDIMETFNMIVDDFKRVEKITDERIYAIENFIKDQHQHNKFLKPFFSAEQTFHSVRKIPIAGSKSSHYDYEWPSPTDLRMLTLEKLTQCSLERLDWYAAGSLWSLKMKTVDGRESPIMGGRNAVDTSYTFREGEEVGAIRLLQSQDGKYVNGL